MTERESLVYSLGRDSAHCERRPTMSEGERASYPSQRSQARMMREAIRRVGARTRKETAQDNYRRCHR